jgi:predicted Zn finger-like uncharacterized protein
MAVREVSCPGCATRFPVEESWLPAYGARVLCPECGTLLSLRAGDGPEGARFPEPLGGRASSEPRKRRSATPTESSP